ncbi:MAG: FtsQ-type POTRA domain-containing protein [Bryobacteraceae bacterium]
MARDNKKSGGIRWRLWLGLAAACLACGSTAAAALKLRDYLSTDPRYTLSRDRQEALAITGLRYASRSKVRHVFDADFGHGILAVPLAERQRRLLGIDWVEDASVSRVWPDRLMVRIRERVPVAFVFLGTSVALIDAEGVLLEPPPQASFTFPVLSGIREDSTEETRRERVQALLRLEEDLGYLAKDVSEVDASDPEDMRVVVQVDHQAVSLLLGDSEYGRRYLNFLGHFQEIQQRTPQARTFDLRLDDRITAKE